MVTYSPLLGIQQVAPNQTNKETTINDGISRLERSLNDAMAVDLTAANVALLAADAQSYGVFVCSGHTVARTLTVPNTKRIFAVKNDGTAAGALTVTIGSGGTAVIAVGNRALLYCDGTNINYIAQGAQPGTLFYDLGFQYGGVPTISEEQAFIAVRAFTLPIAAGASVAGSSIAATAISVFTIKQNTTVIGTITFAAGATVGVFAVASAVNFSALDKLSILAPATPDATLNDIYITLACTR